MKLLVLTICSLISTIYCGVIVQLDTVGDGDVDANLSSDNEPHVSETFESKIGVIRPKFELIGKPPIHRESARLETEGIPSKALSVYDITQQKAANFLNPEPVVDTITEDEKYGNSGDKFYPVGRALVNGYEAFSNLLNKLIAAPKNVARGFSQSITDNLNNLGGKIVGLQ